MAVGHGVKALVLSADDGTQRLSRGQSGSANPTMATGNVATTFGARIVRPEGDGQFGVRAGKTTAPVPS